MSIALMTAAFKTALPSTQKFVLVALCDSANDQGECYPSVRLLSKKCGMSERTVQAAMQALELGGHLRREFRTGRSSVYWMNPRSNCTPAATAPPQQLHPTPAVPAPPPPQFLHPTPAVPAPITINEPSVEPKKKKEKVAPLCVAVSDLVMAGFDEATAAEFIACKAERKAPLTVRAWRDHLREAAKAGWTPMAAAEKVMAKTWKGFESKYVVDERPPDRGRETNYARQMREKYEQVAPMVAAKAPGAPQRLNPMEVLDGLTRITG